MNTPLQQISFPILPCSVGWVGGGFFLVDRGLLTLQCSTWKWQKYWKMLVPLTDSYFWNRQFPNSIFDLVAVPLEILKLLSGLLKFWQ